MKFYKPQTYTETQLRELDEKDIKFPFNDKDAIYDGMKHQYTLTAEYFTERGRNLLVEIDSNNPEKVKHFLQYLTMKVYTYIYTHSKSPRNVLNYIIAKRGITGYSPYEYRQAFLDAMFLEGCYLLDNGDISQITGIDIETMQNMSVDVVRRQDRDWNKDAINILRQLGLNYYGKYNIIAQGMGVEW